ncbi:MAG: hypothetical protein RBG13Loki_3604 [Promethearchaeota archaeon CR_4]|nr:MAG: hypothetical protein RBG13Loki_3604 [Candidatus Lokiarchaeota archaeon CR_4]
MCPFRCVVDTSLLTFINPVAPLVVVISMVLGLTKFISEHLINNPVEVYCGVAEKFHGVVISCADDVVILKDNETHTLTYLNAEKIIAIWGVSAKKKDKDSP